MKFCATEAGCEMKFEKIYGGDGKLYEVLLAKVKGTVWDLLDCKSRFSFAVLGLLLSCLCLWAMGMFFYVVAFLGYHVEF